MLFFYFIIIIFLSILSRLTNKGILISEKIGKYTYYKAIVMRNEYINFETKEFICNVFDGSLENFLDSLIACDQLTDKEKEYLKNWKNNLK
ncbi:BlaI/MecI/CopY family transcriptional regulator [Clostridioides difficile]|uniref:BlaI/MecI/CopY family transcriptional regulator n=1 Tax=Clostridioides difficile TaxID=1496 RepID=UPI0029059255|nr:BlaI/MecI/CopY family transcriptional regulator [Clostridioides difficile]